MAFAVGEMTTPVLLNVLYKRQGMRSFVYIMLSASCLELLFYGLLQTFASCSNKVGGQEKEGVESSSLLNAAEEGD